MGRASKLLEERLSPGHDGSGFQLWCLDAPLAERNRRQPRSFVIRRPIRQFFAPEQPIADRGAAGRGRDPHEGPPNL